MVCAFAACHVPGKKQKVVMDEAFYNAAEMASEEICDCESPSECMANVIERFTDYKDSKEFRDEVTKRVNECLDQKAFQQEYEEHFDEAVEIVANELCYKGGNPRDKFNETTAELYPKYAKYGYQDDPKFKQDAIKRAEKCIRDNAPKVKRVPYDPSKDPNYEPQK